MGEKCSACGAPMENGHCSYCGYEEAKTPPGSRRYKCHFASAASRTG